MLADNAARQATSPWLQVAGVCRGMCEANQPKSWGSLHSPSFAAHNMSVPPLTASTSSAALLMPWPGMVKPAIVWGQAPGMRITTVPKAGASNTRPGIRYTVDMPWLQRLHPEK